MAKGNSGKVCNFLPDTWRCGIFSLLFHIGGLKTQSKDIFREAANPDHTCRRQGAHPRQWTPSTTPRPKPPYRAGSPGRGCRGNTALPTEEVGPEIPSADRAWAGPSGSGARQGR